MCSPAISGHGDAWGLVLWHRGAFLSLLVPSSAPEDHRRRRSAIMAAVLGLFLNFFDFFVFLIDFVFVSFYR